MNTETYYTISVTEIRLRSIGKIFHFMRQVKQIRKQMEAAPGMKKYALHPNGLTVFNTISAWESDEAMYAFMRSGAHAQAMKEVKVVAAATRYTRRRNVAFPDKTEARKWLNEDMPTPLYK